MRIHIGELQKSPFEYDVELSPDFLQEDLEEDIQFDPATGLVTFRMIQDEILASGKLHTKAHAPCARCLNPVEEEINVDVHLYYWPREKEREESKIEDIEPDEPDFGTYEGEYLEPDEELRELVMVETPTIFLCKEDCKGLCHYCGADLNQTTCDCEEQEKDKPVSAWKNQLENLRDELGQ